MKTMNVTIPDTCAGYSTTPVCTSQASGGCALVSSFVVTDPNPSKPSCQAISSTSVGASCTCPFTPSTSPTPTPTPTTSPTPTPTTSPTPTPNTGNVTPPSNPNSNTYQTSVSTVGGSSDQRYTSEALTQQAGKIICSQWVGIPNDAVIMKVTFGSYVDYFKPAGGQFLCDLINAPAGAWYLHSNSPDGPFDPVQQPDARYLGGGGRGQGRSDPVGPYWGIRDPNTPGTGGCGHESPGDVFHCGIAFTLEVSVVNFYANYASLAGISKLDPNTYINGVTPSVATADKVRPCSDYAGIDFKRMIVRVTMGQFVDYFRPVTNFCDFLNVSGQWYWHAFNENGPWKAVNGNHNALLGGWNVYGQDVGVRSWGTFWGAPLGPTGYHAEGGGCCHALREAGPTSFQFWRPFTIDVQVR